MDEQALLDRYRMLGVAIQDYPAAGSVENYRDSLATVGRIEAVIYMAANNNQDAGYAQLFAVNVTVFERFIEALGDKMRDKPFIFTSSVMADVADRLEAQASSSTIESILPYGRTKQMAEKVLLAKADTYGYRPLILRLGSVYGDRAATGLLKSLDGLMGLSLIAPIPYFPGRASVIHVIDVVRLVAELAVNPRGSGIYLVDDGSPVAVGELIRQAAAKAGKQARQIRLPRFMLMPVIWLLRGGVRLGLGACLDLLALLDDIYVVDDTRVWSL